MLRPLLGSPGNCLFEPTCSRYAIIQLRTKNIFLALWAISIRILKCNPLYFILKK